MTKHVRLIDLRRTLDAAADTKKARILMRFFKTGIGEYGEGDRFIGVIMPTLRRIAKQYRTLSTSNAVTLLHSTIHEERMVALIILVDQYRTGSGDDRAHIYHTYLTNTKWINSWDLVDLSAPKIVGNHLVDKSRKILKRLSRSTDLWERRIAIISTFALIRRHEYEDTLKIAKILIHDDYDLIHKAVGWMLREIGKRSRLTLDAFLQKHTHEMPRTMLRYAIERYPERERSRYLSMPSKHRRTS